MQKNFMSFIGTKTIIKGKKVEYENLSEYHRVGFAVRKKEKIGNKD